MILTFGREINQSSVIAFLLFVQVNPSIFHLPSFVSNMLVRAFGRLLVLVLLACVGNFELACAGDFEELISQNNRHLQEAREQGDEALIDHYEEVGLDLVEQEILRMRQRQERRERFWEDQRRAGEEPRERQGAKETAHRAIERAKMESISSISRSLEL